MKIELEKISKDRIETGIKIPLRKWDKDWQLPDKFKTEKYNAILNINKKKVRVGRLRLLGRMKKEGIRCAKKWYEGSSSRGLDYVVRNGYVWCVLKSNLPLQMEITSKELSTDGNWLYLNVPKNYIGVWYVYGNGRINFFILPKKIELNEVFWETFGVLQGEMLIKGGGVKISNCEPKVINLLLEFFDKNKIIEKYMWDITVSINSKDIQKYKREEVSKEIKKYWADKLNFSINRIRTVYWCDQFSSKLEPNYGEINLWFDNASLRKVIDLFLEFVKKNAAKNRNFAIPFLRGLFAAEGNVSVDKKGRLLELRLSAKKLSDRELYKRICNSINIEAFCEIRHHHVRVYGLINFLKCLGYDILRLHEKKIDVFILKIKNFITVRALYLILESPKTVRQLVNTLELNDYRNLNKNLSRLSIESIVNRKVTKDGYIYSSTKRLKMLLDMLN